MLKSTLSTLHSFYIPMFQFTLNGDLPQTEDFFLVIDIKLLKSSHNDKELNILASLKDKNLT